MKTWSRITFAVIGAVVILSMLLPALSE